MSSYSVLADLNFSQARQPMEIRHVEPPNILGTNPIDVDGWQVINSEFAGLA